ncbi:MAG: efflux RND transporter periplasmic adaptor subunit [Candidatus Eisenbacteria bacterium]|uniref:Efflux RND transporter periplasmic adaptor subunit n=1 Tax=Eiseniibacteriota bacterium TaxID=2212470 RepID=A0A933W4I4_UNCEI|nr:efflux RND transporter periplasmic adaptor subunit [Candidatus Eisenbacteria bacterium]
MSRTARWLGACLSLLLVTGALVTSCAKHDGATHTAAAAAKYHCPMHPTYVSDRPGSCPICGMSLTLITAPTDADTAHGAGGTSSGAVEGHAVVELTERELELTGVRTATAQYGELASTVRTVGEVKADETRLRHVHTKVPGSVERLFVSFSGQEVRKGQPLLALYSPELLATQEEYLRALQASDRAKDGPSDDARRAAAEMLDATRRRLELFDVPADVIARIASTRRTTRTITLDAPVSGFVSAKEVFEGMQIEAGTTIFTVTDLSRVWIEAEIYENEARHVRVGQSARLTLSEEPGKVYTARITYLYPFLDTDTRTLRVRFEFDNPGQRLKPGMYANVELQGEHDEGVLVPNDAIMDTGVRQLVYVQTGDRRFEPRAVTVGGRTGDQALVSSGLEAGESVVVQANFLLDSESRLRAALQAVPAATAPADPHAGHRR